jgi:hypothetical protein
LTSGLAPNNSESYSDEGLYTAFIICLTTAIFGGRTGMISGANRLNGRSIRRFGDPADTSDQRRKAGISFEQNYYFVTVRTTGKVAQTGAELLA